MPRYRRSRGRRMSMPRNVVQSFKKVIDHAPASRVKDVVLPFFLANGVDANAGQQSSPTDTTVPTGSVIKGFSIDFPIVNLVNIAMFVWVSIQLVHNGQTEISPRVIGGSPQRNQVFFQKMFMVGQLQNMNFHKNFKIPERFQRMREGDSWKFAYISDQVHTSGGQIIYKFYR